MSWGIVLGLVIGVVVTLLILAPEKRAGKWLSTHCPRLISLALGIGAVAGILTMNLPMSLVCTVVLTLLVFRGYDTEQEETEEIITEVSTTGFKEETVYPPKRTEVDLSKVKAHNGILVIEE